MREAYGNIDAGPRMRERCISAFVSIAPAIAPIMTDEEIKLLLAAMRKLRMGLDESRH
jgi:hypothetical protein